MGNCQAAEAATVLIQHPGNKIERIYWSLSANEVMTSNPGHYVAMVVTSSTTKSENGTPLKQLKLLRPDDTLLIGHVYRLITFEDVLKEFAAKRCVKLGKLLERGGLGLDTGKKESGGSNPNPKSDRNYDKPIKMQHDEVQGHLRLGSSGGSGSNRAMGRQQYGVGLGNQWRPSLQSISEFGT